MEYVTRLHFIITWIHIEVKLYIKKPHHMGGYGEERGCKYVEKLHLSRYYSIISWFLYFVNINITN